MKNNETYQEDETNRRQLNVAKGYFSVQKAGKLDLKVNASTDDGKLHILIFDENKKVYYLSLIHISAPCGRITIPAGFPPKVVSVKASAIKNFINQSTSSSEEYKACLFVKRAACISGFFGAG